MMGTKCDCGEFTLKKLIFCKECSEKIVADNKSRGLKGLGKGPLGKRVKKRA